MAGSLDDTTDRLNISTEFATITNATTTLSVTGITQVTSLSENKTETGNNADVNTDELTTTDQTTVVSSASNYTNDVTGATSNVTLYETSTNTSLFETTDLTSNEYTTEHSTQVISPWKTTVKLDDETSSSLQITNQSLSSKF